MLPAERSVLAGWNQGPRLTDSLQATLLNLFQSGTEERLKHSHGQRFTDRSLWCVRSGPGCRRVAQAWAENPAARASLSGFGDAGGAARRNRHASRTA